jgi:exosortase
LNSLCEEAVNLEGGHGWGSAIARRHAAFGALVAASVILLWKTIQALVGYSFVQESSSHILLIPFVSFALIYIEREKIFRTARSSPIPGLTLILAGAAFYGLARHSSWGAAGNSLLSAAALSLALVWAGAFLLCYGTQAARVAIFPLFFLLLMIPMPDPILQRTIYLLQQGSTEISYLLFKATGTPVLRQGFFLSVPGVTIEVAQECSGIRSSLALFITCLLAAHLFLKTSWKKLCFSLLAFPLAIIKNGIRITTLTLLSLYVDPGFLTGKLHHEGGFVFFLIGLAILAPALLMLQRSEGHRGRSGTAAVAEG